MSRRRKFTEKEKKMVYEIYGGRCAICGNPIGRDKMTMDHKIPLSKGGSNKIENLQLSCMSCNRAKQDLTNTEFMEKLWELFTYNFSGIIKAGCRKMVGKACNYVRMEL